MNPVDVTGNRKKKGRPGTGVAQPEHGGRKSARGTGRNGGIGFAGKETGSHSAAEQRRQRDTVGHQRRHERRTLRNRHEHPVTRAYVRLDRQAVGCGVRLAGAAAAA